MLPVVIDFETKKSFREAPQTKDLGISVAGVYDYATDTYAAYEEHELSHLFKLLEHASLVIGFNSDSFDLPVLQPYYAGDITQFRSFDILTDVKKLLGYRLRLDDLVKATLGEGKSGHGLQAIQFYKEGRIDELKKYCIDDVRLTKELFEYGVEHNKILYPGDYGDSQNKVLHVQWGKYKNYSGGDDSLSLTLPFS